MLGSRSSEYATMETVGWRNKTFRKLAGVQHALLCQKMFLISRGAHTDVRKSRMQIARMKVIGMWEYRLPEWNSLGLGGCEFPEWKSSSSGGHMGGSRGKWMDTIGAYRGNQEVAE